MKKIVAIILTLILAISMLTACGGGNTTNNNTPATASNSSGNSNKSNDSAQPVKDVIKASQLISKEDAASLLEDDVKEYELDEQAKKLMHFNDQITYRAKKCSVTIQLWQEVLHDKSSDFENGLLIGGWTKYLQEMEKSTSTPSDKYNLTIVDGKFSEYHIIEMSSTQTLYTNYKDYRIVIMILNPPAGVWHDDTEDEKKWKHEKIIEFGDLASERLADIIG